jgi:hypothetical protein
MEVKVAGMDVFPEEQHRGHHLTSKGAKSKGSVDAWRMSCSVTDATTRPYRRESVPLGPAVWPTVVLLLRSMLGRTLGIWSSAWTPIFLIAFSSSTSAPWFA